MKSSALDPRLAVFCILAGWFEVVLGFTMPSVTITFLGFLLLFTGYSRKWE